MLSPKIWLGLSQTTRRAIAEKLILPHSGGVEVVDNRVVSDGYTPNDLALITVEKLQTLLNSKETDFYALFNKLVEQIETPLVEDNQIVISAKLETLEKLEDVKPVRVKKKAKKI
jgi:hypothetical protein